MKKSYIYILIFIFGLFSFSSDVWAAKELTCLYEKGLTVDKVLLIQKKNGKRIIYKNPKNVGINEEGWYLSKAKASNFDQYNKPELDSFGNLKSCPNAQSTDVTGAGTVFFKHFDEDDNWLDKVGTQKLEENYGSVKKPAITSSGTVENEKLDEELKGEDCPAPNSDEYSKLWPDGLGDGLGTSKTGNKFTGACLYSKTVTFTSNNGSTEKGCHLVQVNFNKEDVEIIEYDPIKGEEYSSESSFIFGNLQGTFGYDSGYTGKAILDSSNGIGNCISPIRVRRYVNLDKKITKIDTSVYLTGSKGEGYNNVYSKGKTSGTGTKLDVGFSMDIGFEDIEDIKNCEDLFGEEIVGMFKSVWNFVRILVPIILIVLGTLDFSKAVFSGNEDGMKKAQSKFIKRIIIAVAIFVIPSVLSLLLNIANSVFGDFGTDICGILG